MRIGEIFGKYLNPFNKNKTMQNTFTCQFCGANMPEIGFACTECLDVLKFILDRNRHVYKELFKASVIRESVNTLPTENDFIEAICTAFDTTREQLFGKRDNRNLKDASHVYVYVMDQVLKTDHGVIARKVNRTKSNIYAGNKRVLELLQYDRHFKAKTQPIFDMVILHRAEMKIDLMQK